MPPEAPEESKEAETFSKVEFVGLVRQNLFKIETTLKNLNNDGMTGNFPSSEHFLLSLYWPEKFTLIFITINMRPVNLHPLFLF